MENYRHNQRCPECNQFIPKYGSHTCPPSSNQPNSSGTGSTWQENDDGAVADLTSKRIVTLDDLIEACQIDLGKWYIDRHVVNKWEVGAKDSDGNIVVEPLFQIKAWLKPLAPLNDVLVAIEEAKRDLLEYSPIVVRLPRTGLSRTEEDLMYCVNLPDVHFGMLSWHEETGTNWDMKIATEAYMDTLSTLLSRARYLPVKLVIVPIGNDYFNTDFSASGKGGETTKGTPQEVDGRWPKMFREGTQLLVRGINECVRIADTRVIVVPGNHDRHRMFYAGEVLSAYFRRDENVRVNNSPRLRKYEIWGANLLGFTHGDEEKLINLPRIMAHEEPDLWASSTYREWQIGHRHAKKDLVYDDIDGVVVRVVPSIAPNDEWHTRKGYNHMRAGEANLYDSTSGPVGHFRVNL